MGVSLFFSCSISVFFCFRLLAIHNFNRSFSLGIQHLAPQLARDDDGLPQSLGSGYHHSSLVWVWDDTPMHRASRSLVFDLFRKRTSATSMVVSYHDACIFSDWTVLTFNRRHQRTREPIVRKSAAQSYIYAIIGPDNINGFLAQLVSASP